MPAGARAPAHGAGEDVEGDGEGDSLADGVVVGMGDVDPGSGRLGDTGTEGTGSVRASGSDLPERSDPERPEPERSDPDLPCPGGSDVPPPATTLMPSKIPATPLLGAGSLGALSTGGAVDSRGPGAGGTTALPGGGVDVCGPGTAGSP